VPKGGDPRRGVYTPRGDQFPGGNNKRKSGFVGAEGPPNMLRGEQKREKLQARGHHRRETK